MFFHHVKSSSYSKNTLHNIGLEEHDEYTTNIWCHIHIVDLAYFAIIGHNLNIGELSLLIALIA